VAGYFVATTLISPEILESSGRQGRIDRRTRDRPVPTNKSAIERNHDCLKANGWLPQSGTPKILPRAFVAAAAMFATLNSDYLACLNAQDAKR
jgi:hypothetical protein